MDSKQDKKVILICGGQVGPTRSDILKMLLGADCYEVIDIDSITEFEEKLPDLARMLEALEVRPLPVYGFTESTGCFGRQGKGERKRNKQNRWR